MRRIVSLLTFAAVLSGSLPLAAQTEISPELGDRLRAAVEQRQAAAADPAAAAFAARLAQAPLLEAEALDDLTAPVALYPDALLAQVLVAAAFPDQIQRAGDLIAAGDDMTDAELNDALAAEDWDPSVLVLLSGFPTVLARMADDIDWTTQLGAAMLRQDGDVLAAVQRMRLRAEQAGNLQSNAAQVVDRTPEAIAIRPADPQRIHVPDYDPDVVYVSSRAPATYVPTPYAAPQPAPGIDMQTALISGAVGFGAGYLLSEMLQDDDKDNDRNKGWDGYWRRHDVIDWRGRRIYPRPPRDLPPPAWSDERDRYWDRGSGRWRLDEAARRRDEQERRALTPWMVVGDRGAVAPSEAQERRLRAWRERARAEAAQERSRDRAERRRDQREEQAREARHAEQAREEKARQAEAERERRRAQEARKDRRAEEARKAEKAAAERRAEAERRAKAERARAQERREQAARDERASRPAAAPAPARKEKEKAQPPRKVESARKPPSQAAEKPPRKPEAKAPPTAKPAAKQQPPKAKEAAPRREQAQRPPQRTDDRKKKCKPGDDRKSCRG